MCAWYRDLLAELYIIALYIKQLGPSESECSALQVMHLAGALGFELYMQVWAATFSHVKKLSLWVTTRLQRLHLHRALDNRKGLSVGARLGRTHMHALHLYPCAGC